MGEKYEFIFNKPVVFSLVLLLIISLYWHYQDYVRQQTLENSVAQLQARVMILQDQLQAVQKARSETAAELQELLAMDWQNRAVTQESRARDWQQKYQELELEYNNLLQEHAGMQYQHDIDMARMKRAQDFQSGQNNKLRGELTEKQQKIAAMAGEITQLESSTSDLTKTITGLENKLEKQGQVLKQQTEETTAGNLRVATDKTRAYRIARLQSLKTAMNGQTSSNRKAILTDVLPTIPEGVNGMEFITLVAGMESNDILGTLINTHKNINHPVSDQVKTLLVEMMVKEDANKAVLILSEGK